MCEELGFLIFQRAEPINNLMKEIRKQVKKQTRLTKNKIMLTYKRIIRFLVKHTNTYVLLIFYGIITQWAITTSYIRKRSILKAVIQKLTEKNYLETKYPILIEEK